jgi:hypothetical protein
LPYDIDLAVKLAYDSGMPEIKEWENELRTAVYRLAKANTPSLPKGN